MITIKGELTDLNTYIRAERSNRFMAANIKKSNTKLVMYQLKAYKGHYTEPQHIVFTWYVPNKKKDPDNLSFAQKFVLDGLVSAGILSNDGWGQVLSLTHHFKVDKSNPRVVVEFHLEKPVKTER